MINDKKIYNRFLTKEILKPIDLLDDIIHWEQSDVKKMMQISYLKEVNRSQKLMKDWILTNNKKDSFKSFFMKFEKAFKSEFKKRGYDYKIKNHDVKGSERE